MPLDEYRTGRSFALFLGLFFAVWSVRATVLFRVDELLPEGGARQLYGLLSKLLLWLVPALLYAVALRGDRPGRSLRLGWPQSAPRGWLTWSIGLLTLGAVAWDVIQRHDTGWAELGHRFLQEGFPVLAWTLPVVWIEEVVFRGLVLTELNERLRFWAANLTAAALFVAIHWPHWLWVRGLDGTILRDSGGVLFVGLVTGYLAHRTRSVWPAVVWHAANNTIVGLW